MNKINNLVQLPYCKYPTAIEKDKCGLLNLPTKLPQINWEQLNSFRVDNFNETILNNLENSEMFEMAQMLARGFVKNEPTNRYLKIPKIFPKALKGTHSDEFGASTFGAWSAENIFFWLIRLAFLTNPSDPIENIKKNQDLLNNSLVVKNNTNKIVAGVLCKSSLNEEKMLRNDLYLSAIFGLYSKSLEFIFSQENEAVTALEQKYPDFEESMHHKKVATALMLAKKEEFSKESAFELLIRSMELLSLNGYNYVILSASNQWTGAASEMLNATRVHYKPFRDKVRVAKTGDGSNSEMHSIDGYLSNKDSGIMFYVIKLK